MYRKYAKLRAVRFKADDLTPLIALVVGEQPPDNWKYAIEVDLATKSEYVFITRWRGRPIGLLVYRNGDWWRLTHPCMQRRPWEREFPDAESLMRRLGWEYENIEPCTPSLLRWAKS